MLVVTADQIPGWDIRGVCGQVVAVAIRNRLPVGINLVGGLGGDFDLTHTRNEAVGRLMAEARNRGGNAIVAMRFDTASLNDSLTEICAYGTAVQAVPVTAQARETAELFGYELSQHP